MLQNWVWPPKLGRTREDNTVYRSGNRRNDRSVCQTRLPRCDILTLVFLRDQRPVVVDIADRSHVGPVTPEPAQTGGQAELDFVVNILAPKDDDRPLIQGQRDGLPEAGTGLQFEVDVLHLGHKTGDDLYALHWASPLSNSRHSPASPRSARHASSRSKSFTGPPG